MCSYPCELSKSSSQDKDNDKSKLIWTELNLNFLPPGSSRAYHCFQVVVQQIENSKNSYAKPTLTGMGTEYVNTIDYKPQIVC